MKGRAFRYYKESRMVHVYQKGLQGSFESFLHIFDVQHINIRQGRNTYIIAAFLPCSTFSDVAAIQAVGR